MLDSVGYMSIFFIKSFTRPVTASVICVETIRILESQAVTARCGSNREVHRWRVPAAL